MSQKWIALVSVISVSALAADEMTMQKMQTSVGFNEIHHINLKEVELAKLALDRASSPQVKEFAQMIRSDHERSDRELTSLAKSQKVSLNSFSSSTWEKAAMDDLKKMKGAQFDEAFVMMMKDGHQTATLHLEKLKEKVKDPQLGAFIEKTLPVMKDHSTKVAAIKLGPSSDEQAAGEVGDVSEAIEPDEEYSTDAGTLSP